MATQTLTPMILMLSLAAACRHAPDARDPAAPAFVSQHLRNPEDLRAIEAVVAAYPQAVNRGDQAAFEALLLSPDIAFTSTRTTSSGYADLQRYPQFRKSVFESGRRYEQKFYNVRIEQDGDLAQASLDFVTQDAQTGRGAFGWKSLQLLKVQGRWKIASEIYTARELPSSSPK